MRHRKLCRPVVLRKDVLRYRPELLRGCPELLRRRPDLRMRQAGLCGSVVLLGPELCGPELRCPGPELLLGPELRLREQLRLRMLLPPLRSVLRSASLRLRMLELLCGSFVLLGSGRLLLLGPELRMCQAVLCGSVVLLGSELCGPGPELLLGPELRLREQLRLRMLLPPSLRFVRHVQLRLRMFELLRGSVVLLGSGRLVLLGPELRMRQAVLCGSVVLLGSGSLLLLGPELRMRQAMLCSSFVLLRSELRCPGPELLLGPELRLREQLRLRMLLPPSLLRFV